MADDAVGVGVAAAAAVVGDEGLEFAAGLLEGGGAGPGAMVARGVGGRGKGEFGEEVEVEVVEVERRRGDAQGLEGWEGVEG